MENARKLIFLMIIMGLTPRLTLSSLPFDSTQAQSALNILAINSTLTPANAIEANIKDINEIYLTTLAVKLPVSLIQRQLIEQLANDCPYTAGPAVYTARVLLNMIEPEVRFYSNTCDFSQQQQRLIKNTAKAEEILLYPNPASDKLYITNNSYVKLRIVITDPSGKVSIDKVIKSELDLKNLNNGVYYYQLYSDEILIEGRKLVILR